MEVQDCQALNVRDHPMQQLEDAVSAYLIEPRNADTKSFTCDAPVSVIWRRDVRLCAVQIARDFMCGQKR